MSNTPNKIETQKTKVFCTISVEDGCDPAEGEYDLYLRGILGGLDIYPNPASGQNDIDLIHECIQNHFDDLTRGHSPLLAEIILQESGEREGYGWNKYFIVESYALHEI